MTNPTFLQKKKTKTKTKTKNKKHKTQQVCSANQKARSQMKMAYITGIRSQMEGPEKQM